MEMSKELIKEFVKSEEFKNTGDIMAAIKKHVCGSVGGNTSM